jgi:DeoR/GlpR family transcriptional regulator of sugar metabolism
MILRERRERILRALQSGGASVRDLAQALDVSESTIRRDLQLLDRNGELTRTYGGAVLLPRAVVNHDEDVGAEEIEQPFDNTSDFAMKNAMAVKAAALVEDDSVIILDIGTTTPLVARALKGRPVTIITSNVAVLDELRDDDAVRLVMLGGVLRRNYHTLVGSLTELALSQVSADLVFLSCTGVRPSGHIVDNMAVEAPIKQSMIAAADRVVLLASEQKFPGTGALRLCSIKDVDVLITTEGAHQETVNICREAGGEVIVA